MNKIAFFLVGIGLAVVVQVGGAQSGSTANARPPNPSAPAPETNAVAAAANPTNTVSTPTTNAVTAPATNAATTLSPGTVTTNLPPPSPPLKVEVPKEAEAPAPSPTAPPTTNAPAVAVTTTNAPAGLTNAPPEAEEKLPLVKLDNELMAAIKGLAEMASLNLQIDPKLSTGSNVMVKVTFRDITARQALAAVLKNNDLILVPDPETQTVRVTKKEPGALEPTFMKVFPLQYSNPTNMSNMVFGLKSSFGDSKTTSRLQVYGDTRTSSLVVVATTNELAAVENLINSLDTQTRQVLIAARLLETSRNPQAIRGIDWSGTLLSQRITAGNGVAAATATTTSPGQSSTVTTPSGRTITTTADSSSQSSVSTVLGALGGSGGLAVNTARGFAPNIGFLNADGVSAVLSFLNQDSDTQVIATPRAVTLDTQEARLLVTKVYPSYTITPGSANVPPTAAYATNEVGTILVVTPRISGTNHILLTVEAEVSNIDSKDVQTINGQLFQNNVYAKRKLNTRVMVPNGNTLVMGGLVNDSTTKQYKKVPLLGDLPLVGLAFRVDSKNRSKQNLLIFITPSIIREQDFQLLPESKFLQSSPREGPEVPISPLDSGKPLNWSHPGDWKQPQM